MDADNDIETCYRATRRTLHKVFDELYHQRVDLEGILLKPNMVISGKGSPTQASAEEVAEWTIRCFRETVPAAVPGNRLPLGRSVRPAGEREPERDQLARGEQPWVLSFSYGRALQAPALAAWGGQERERRGRPVVARAARALQQRRGRGALLRGDGGARPVDLEGLASGCGSRPRRCSRRGRGRRRRSSPRGRSAARRAGRCRGSRPRSPRGGSGRRSRCRRRRRRHGRSPSARRRRRTENEPLTQANCVRSPDSCPTRKPVAGPTVS